MRGINDAFSESDALMLSHMTGMPKAALAREQNLAYACCAVIAYGASGKTCEDIHTGFRFISNGAWFRCRYCRKLYVRGMGREL